ncbi:MAG: hypothetical protein WBR24_16930 [Desulfobacterales bacterium]|jgi:hypothetical protein
MTDDEPLEAISLAKAETFVFRARIDTPVRTSFGTMYDRPSVLIRLEDKDGAYGWGEVWCNFPSVGAEHRANLINEVLIPLLFEQSSIQPTETLSFLTPKTHILTIQCGEPGPLSQAIAVLDIAIWDLIARKRGKPLYTLLSTKAVEKIPVYASGINPEESLKTVNDCRKEGYRAFKLKAGFGHEFDFPNINRIFEQLSANETLMLDAKQAWSLAEAKKLSIKYLIIQSNGLRSLYLQTDRKQNGLNFHGPLPYRLLQAKTFAVSRISTIEFQPVISLLSSRMCVNGEALRVGGCNAVDGPKDKQDVDLFFAGALRPTSVC